MDAHSSGSSPSSDKIRHEDFPLCDLDRGKPDKLGYIVEHVFYLAPEYAVYKTISGVSVHYSNIKDTEKQQRSALSDILTELADLRYFTTQIRDRHGPTIYDYNVAQAIMLVLEEKNGDAKKLLKATLALAARRYANDNTIRYLRACVFMAVFLLFLLLLGLIFG